MTTLAAIEYLESGDGAAHLRAAAELDLSGQALLRELTRLGRLLGPERAGAVIEQTALRRRAAVKFSGAREMLFTPEGLEQASGELLAAHSAVRYRGMSRVADLCCGIGGDTLALAREAHVEAYDLDPVRLACARHNAEVSGLIGRVHCHLADVRTAELLPSGRGAGGSGGIDGIFFDPSRRSNGRRVFSLEDYEPPVSLVERWLLSVPAIGVKVAPGVLHKEVTWDCEQEFVADGTDLKEGLLWFGSLASVSRRATLLPDGVTLTGTDAPEPVVGEPLAWLYDPSPAVTRAGLIWELASLLGARQVDPRLAYLTGPELVESAFAKPYAIESWMPFSLKRLRAHLRLLGVGRVEVHRRGAPLVPAELERQLRQEGRGFRLLFVTRLRGKMIVLICTQGRSS